jgi:heme-degrading monooxygenase HmoA
MNVVIRHYKGAPELMDELERRSDEVEKLIRGVPGFVAYHLVRTSDGGFSISVYEDSTGTQESVKQAAEFIRTTLPSLTVSPPEVIDGESIISFSA